jgi:short-subunit dehydrogenase
MIKLNFPGSVYIVAFMKDPFHLEQTGVRVVALCPGATSTGIIDDIRKQLLHSSFEPAWQRDTANSIYQK